MACSRAETAGSCAPPETEPQAVSGVCDHSQSFSTIKSIPEINTKSRRKQNNCPEEEEMNRVVALIQNTTGWLKEPAFRPLNLSRFVQYTYVQKSCTDTIHMYVCTNRASWNPQLFLPHTIHMHKCNTTKTIFHPSGKFTPKPTEHEGKSWLLHQLPLESSALCVSSKFLVVCEVRIGDWSLGEERSNNSASRAAPGTSLHSCSSRTP